MSSFAILRSRGPKHRSIFRLKRDAIVKKPLFSIRILDQDLARDDARARSNGSTSEGPREMTVKFPEAESIEDEKEEPSAKHNGSMDESFVTNGEEDSTDHLELSRVSGEDVSFEEPTISSDIEIMQIEEGQKAIVLLKVGDNPFILKQACVHVTLLSGGLVVDGYNMQLDEKITCIAAGSYSFSLLEPKLCESPADEEEIVNRTSKSSKQEHEMRRSFKRLCATDDTNQISVILIEKMAATCRASRAFHLIKSSKSAYLPNLRFFEISMKMNDTKFDYQQIKAWDEALDQQLSVKPSTVLMLLGPCNSGKSTLLKRLINRLSSNTRLAEGRATDVSQVAFVDLDPGQSEFSPPGALSVTKLPLDSCQPLFPVAFANAIHHEPDFVVSVASTSPQSDPDAYARGILAIAKFVKANYHQKCPVFVNTVGWIRGLGRSLLVDAIKSINPSDVIELVDSNRRRLGGDDGYSLDACRPRNLFSFTSVTTPGLGWTAESQMPNNCSFLTAYNYIQLQFWRTVERMGVVGQWNRSTQVICNFLSGSDLFHFKGLLHSDKHRLDMNKISIYSTYSRQRLPSNILSELLDLAWVQLATGEVDLGHTFSFDKQLPCRSVPTLSNNQVLGYGITIVEPLEEEDIDDEDEEQVEPMDHSSQATESTHIKLSSIEGKKLMVMTHLKPEQLARVNLLILPQGISVPNYILRQASY